MKHPTNLRRFRKRRLREDQQRASGASRALEGETKAERAARAKRESLRERTLAGARRVPTDGDAD